MYALNVMVITLNSFCKEKYITVAFAQYSNKIEGILELDFGPLPLT